MRHPTTLSALAAALAGLAAAGAIAGTPSPADARYEKDRAACLSGQSHQDQATCLREAGAARDEAKRGALARPDPQVKKNALQRCEALPAADREDCRTRVEGQGSQSGSVEGGGIYRETVTRTVEPAPKK